MTLEKTLLNLGRNSGNFLTNDLIKKSLVIWYDNRKFNLTYLDGNYDDENYKFLKTSDQIQIYEILKEVPF